MKAINFYLCFVVCLLSVYLYAQETEIVYLSGKDAGAPVDWEFMVSDGMRAHEWTTIPVPSNWELHGFGAYNYGHDKNKVHEIGYYRYHFKARKSWKNKRVFIVFDGSMTDTEVKINGKSAGPVHQGAFYRFQYDIGALLHFSKDNLLEVNVKKMSDNESVNMAERCSDYWVFGGIFRPVWLKIVPKEYIKHSAIDARANGQFLIKVYFGGLKKADNVEVRILGSDGKLLTKAFHKKINKKDGYAVLQTKVTGQENWTAESPNLYYAQIFLKDGNKTLHTNRERFGFRTIEVREGKGIFLNGQRITLKGCGRHSFRPESGRALSRNDCYKDIILLKEMNMNAVRMSHYPPDSYFLDLCDEYGIYVLDELAGWQKPPYDTPTGKRLIREMVERDVNHPAVLFWDNGNEGGWNVENDSEFARYDPQKRRVLHPWELHGGIDTDHYESYESVLKKMDGSNIFMPTEHLHGLYDGGLGAGLDDFWKLMWGKPLTGGMFLWVFADEGVVRTDKNYIIDTDGNHAPDGILGPHHEKEASFYTIKEIWSPIYIDSERKVVIKSGIEIPVENRYDFTNMNQCRFNWKLVKYPQPGTLQKEDLETACGSLACPNILPHTKGRIKIDLPRQWQAADGFVLTALDKNGREIYTWKWKLKSNSAVNKTFVKTSGEHPQIQEEDKSIIIKSGDFEYYFDKSNGSLQKVWQGAHLIPFGNGPVFVVDKEQIKSGAVKIDINNAQDSVSLSVKNHAVFNQFQWTIYGSGWLKLEYAYSYHDSVKYMGISFDYPEKRMQSMKWLGKGPYCVWKNRLKGQTVDVYENRYKNFKGNTVWDYPEFCGYYADFNWATFDTDDGLITIAADTDGLFLRVYTQEDGDEPRRTKMSWPQGDISFLHAIPPIGTKFQQAWKLGPQSKEFKADGKYTGVLYLYFGKAD